MVELLCAEKAIFKATKCLADAQALESQLHANFYMLQSDKATSLMQKTDLDIGITTLAAMKCRLYRHPTPGEILHSKNYHCYCQLMYIFMVKYTNTSYLGSNTDESSRRSFSVWLY